MIQLSAVIITYNESENIEACINALHAVADEIIVIDSYSTDNTRELAEKMGAKVYLNHFEGFGTQKAFAISKASFDWILSVDADEVLSPELQASILKEKANPEYDGYYVKILTNYCGKWIRHCGWYPQTKLRLLNRNKGYINSNKVHEGFEMSNKSAKTCTLNGDLLHHSYKNLSAHTRKIQLYTELAAKNSAEKGRNISLLKLFFGPKWTFFYHYIIRLGILDGYWGYILCKNISYESFMKYTKIRHYSKLNKTHNTGTLNYEF